MNVVRLEMNSLVSTRGKRGRGKPRADTIVPNNRVLTALPKYEFGGERWPLVNLDPSSSTTRTPSRNPRCAGAITTSSSSVRNSAFRHRQGLGTSASAAISTGSVTTEPDSCNILALTSGRADARGEVGMAVIDIRYPHMILSQISDCHTYANTLSKILAMQPIEIIIPDTMGERSIYPNGLYRMIKEKFGSINITEVARMHFHDSAGLDRIKTHCAEEFASVELYVKQKYYALAAAAALFKYVEYIQHIVYAPKSMKIEFHGSKNNAMIDIDSAQNLELVTSQGGPTNFTLFGCLDRCSTPMGRRLLRVSILQPPCNLEVIQSRQDCVAEFVSNRSLHFTIQPVVKRLYGTSRLLSIAYLTSQADSVSAAEKNLNYILLLKNIIDVIPELDSVLANAQAPFFRKVCENLKDPRYQAIKSIILSIVHPEARSVMGFTSSNMQRCFAIRSGISEMLDIARQTYCELIDDMVNLVEKLGAKYNLPLTLGCSPKLGYHIEMVASRRENLLKKVCFPDELIEVHQQKGTIFMTTEYLMVLSQHCKEACQELHLMSNVLLNESLTNIRDDIGCLLKLSDDIAELDIVSSLAQISSIPDYVKPVFGSRLELRNSRHPVMDICGDRAPIPNDILASVYDNFHTITGPNMSGKSVYLKQIVLLQIMAQIGCYVPASEAQIRITDRIFCKMTRREDNECDASTFVLEAKEIHYVLQSITPTSLVILDELCRHTTVEEGTSIAWAIAEKLHRNSQAFVFNATHFLYLTRLPDLGYNVTNHYFLTESKVSSNDDTRLIYTHRLNTGIANVWNYGIALARSTGLPDQVISLAQSFATEIAKSVKPLQLDESLMPIKRDSNDLLYGSVVGDLAALLEQRQLTLENIVKIAREKNLPNIIHVRNVISKVLLEKPQETISGSHSASAQHFVKPKTLEMKLQLKREASAENLSSNRTLKKARPKENYQSPAAMIQLSKYSGKVAQTTTVENKTRPNVFVNKNSKAFYEPSGPDTDSLNSTSAADDGESCAISGDRVRKSFTPMSATSGDDNKSRINSLVQQDTDTAPPTSQPACYSGVSSTISIYSEDSSVPTQIAQRMARKKEADIFRIIEGNNFDETSFYRSFMNPPSS